MCKNSNDKFHTFLTLVCDRYGTNDSRFLHNIYSRNCYFHFKRKLKLCKNSQLADLRITYTVGVHMQIHIGHTTLESPHSRSSICSHPARTLDTAKHHAHHRTQTESTAKTEDCGGPPCIQRQHLTCHRGF